MQTLQARYRWERGECEADDAYFLRYLSFASHWIVACIRQRQHKNAIFIAHQEERKSEAGFVSTEMRTLADLELEAHGPVEMTIGRKER